jgi:PAS domain S-box-containing protein
MAKTKIIYRSLLGFLLFALLLVAPLTITILRHVDTIIAEQAAGHIPGKFDHARVHREIAEKIGGEAVPYGLYILFLALMMAVFFSREMLISLKGLKRGSQAVKDGDFDLVLPVNSDDELGDVTKAFNEMTAALREKSVELKKKDLYVDAMLDPLWVVDGDNRIVDVNPAFTRLFGYEREEVIGAPIYDFFDERNAAVMLRRPDKKGGGGTSSVYETSIVSKDGSRIPVLVSSSTIYAGDRVVGNMGIVKDFSEQEELRNELRRAKEYVETIMDSIQDHLIVIDKEYKIVRANKIALMRAAGPVTGESCHSVSHGLDRPCWTEGQECPAQTVFITGKNFRATHQHIGAGGEKRFHEILASPMKDASGNVVHVIESIRDVTERLTHEEQIYNKNLELVTLNSIAGLLSRSLRADEIFAKVLDELIDMLRMDGGGIFFIDDAGKEMVCQYHRGISEEYVKVMGRIKVGEDVPGKVAATGHVIASSDLSKDQSVERSFIKHSGMKGYCCFPVRGKERIIGVFCLFSFREHRFTAEEENILTSVGEMTGIAIENIRLYEKMRGLYEYQTKQREEEQAQILSLSSKLGSAIELKEVLNPVLEVIRNTFGADFAWLLMSDNESNLTVKSATGPVRKDGDITYPGAVSSIEGYSAGKTAPTVFKDIRSESKFYLCPEIAASSYQSAIAVPMHIGEKTVGVYSLYYLGGRIFKDEELHFLRIIANILAVSIERSEYYARAIAEKGLSDTILQSVADGIITVDGSGSIISVNKAFERMTGVPATEAVGLPICNVFRFSEENVDFRLSLGECFETALEGSGGSREAVLTTASGGRMAVLISSAPVLDTDGAVTGVVNLMRDVSREKEIDRMKSEIIRSVSHEFRTPLSAIVGMTEMILEGDIDGSRTRKYLSTILSEGVRLSNMVSDLLSIARIESGKETVKYETIAVRDVLSGLLGSFSTLVERKKAQVRLDIEGSGYIVADEDKLTQLLTILLDNSLMFSDEGCVIGIRIGEKPGGVEIEVSDNGWGIPQEDIAHLTERFYRGRHGQKIKGTGLGLYICREIVTMHGGDMRIESELGKGTTVTLSLPKREVQ